MVIDVEDDLSDERVLSEEGEESRLGGGKTGSALFEDVIGIGS